jgi:hypothetical protein
VIPSRAHGTFDNFPEAVQYLYGVARIRLSMRFDLIGRSTMKEFLKRCAIVAGAMYFAVALYGAYRLHHSRPANVMSQAQEDACFTRLDCPLPHRAITQNWGQGHSPGRNACPHGTLPYYLDNNDIFLECIRGPN